MMHSTGILAAVSGFHLPLQILRSGRGYYIGTANDAGPVSRESEEYFSTRQAAEQALQGSTWTQRQWA